MMQPTRRQVVFTVEPTLVKGGDEAYVLRKSATLEVPGLIWQIGSFLGVDTGDIVECHAEVLDVNSNLRLYARSMHKEAPGIYDAWDWRRGVWPVDLPSRIRVEMLCRVTGRNWTVFTKRWNPLTAIFHGEVVIEHSVFPEPPK